MILMITPITLQEGYDYCTTTLIIRLVGVHFDAIINIM